VRIYAGSDHAGFSLRKILVERLRAQGREVVDLGTDSDAACDYPEFAHAVANRVRSEPGAMGILVCATGQGMAMAAGKVRGIRAALPLSVEAARLSRIDNNANVLCLAGRFFGEADACAMADTWLATSFAGGRHARRIAKVAAIETASALAFVTESERLRLAELGVPAKLFERDPSLFTDDPAAHALVRERLAWISLPQEMTDKVREMTEFADHVRQARLREVVVLANSEDAAASAGVCRVWGSGGMRFHVAPVGDPKALESIEAGLHLDSTLVLLLSRSTRADPALIAQEQRLWSKMLDQCLGNAQRAGQHFAAVTSTGSDLAQLAESHRYAKVFLDPASVEESFGVLGFAGLLPAMLAGLDPARLVTRANQMSETCRGERLEDNPGASLGVLLGAMAKHGRRKLTILASRSLEPLVGWIATLFGRAPQAARRGIVVLSGEPLRASYRPNRVFVHLQAIDDPSAIAPETMESLHIAGQPYIQITVPDRYEIAAEIFRWQMAAAVAAIALGTNPFVETAGSPSTEPDHAPG
jgi:RpiB/LacA/LacB family sugar-phosphate isomerase